MRYKIRVFFQCLGCCVLLAMCASSFAWSRGVSIGYGSGADPNHPEYNNSGAFLNAEFTSLVQRSWVNCTINGSLGRWYSNTPVNKDLTTVAASVAFRVYVWNGVGFHPFLLVSAGPAYLSNRKFGLNTQGMNFAFESIWGAGFEAGKLHRLDVNLRFVHFSNAYTAKPNEGFNIYYVVSLGILI